MAVVDLEFPGAFPDIASRECLGQTESGASMETIMGVYPRHKAVVDVFVEKGEVIGIGPFTDRGNMAIFRTREAAEAFTKQDPFILEGLVKSFRIRDWDDQMLK